MNYHRLVLPIGLAVLLFLLFQVSRLLNLPARATATPAPAPPLGPGTVGPVLPTSANPFLRAQDLKFVGEKRLSELGWSYFHWSPDGTQMLLSVGDATLAILNLKTGDLRYMPVPAMEFLGAVWSPDSQAIAYAAPFRWQPAQLSTGQTAYWPESLLPMRILQIVQLSDNPLEPTSQITETQSELNRFIHGRPVPLPQIEGIPIAWLLDGRLVYRDASGFWSVRTEEARAGSDTIEAPQPLPGLSGKDLEDWISPAPDGRAVVLGDTSEPGEQSLWMVRPDGTRVQFDRSSFSGGDCCAWAPDGSYLYFFSNDPLQGIYRVDRSGNERQRVFPAISIAEPGDFVSMGISPDGQVIAFEWAKQGGYRPLDHTQLYLVNRDGTGLEQLTTDASMPHRRPSWSPDGTQIAYLRALGQLWVAQLQRVPCSLPFGC